MAAVSAVAALRMDFSARLQRSIHKLDTLDTQRIGWQEILTVTRSLNHKTASLFFKGLRRHSQSLQRPSARVLACRAYVVVVVVVVSNAWCIHDPNQYLAW